MNCCDSPYHHHTTCFGDTNKLFLELRVFRDCGYSFAGDNGSATLPKVGVISKISAKRFLFHSVWAEVYSKKVSVVPKLRKKKPGQTSGHDRPEKDSAKYWFEAARFRVRDRHRSANPTTAPWNLNESPSLGAPIHALVTFSFHETTGHAWWAPSRRLIQNYLGAAV